MLKNKGEMILCNLPNFVIHWKRRINKYLEANGKKRRNENYFYKTELCETTEKLF